MSDRQRIDNGGAARNGPRAPRQAVDDPFSSAVGQPDQPSTVFDGLAVPVAESPGPSPYPDLHRGPARPDELEGSTGLAALAERVQAERVQRREGPSSSAYRSQDEYLGTDWIRMLLGVVVSLAVLGGIIGGGVYLFDRVNNASSSSSNAVAGDAPTEKIDIFACAGDEDPILQGLPPRSSMIKGRTADAKWLAYENPTGQPRRQLWIRATDVPDFDPSRLGIVRCAERADEFPEATVAPEDLPTPSPSPTGQTTPTATSGPVAATTPLPTLAPTPSETPTGDPTEPPTETPPPTEPPTEPPTATPVPTDPPPTDPPPTDPPPTDPPPTDPPPTDPPPTDPPPTDPPPTDPPPT